MNPTIQENRAQNTDSSISGSNKNETRAEAPQLCLLSTISNLVLEGTKQKHSESHLIKISHPNYKGIISLKTTLRLLSHSLNVED